MSTKFKHSLLNLTFIVALGFVVCSCSNNGKQAIPYFTKRFIVEDSNHTFDTNAIEKNTSDNYINSINAKPDFIDSSVSFNKKPRHYSITNSRIRKLCSTPIVVDGTIYAIDTAGNVFAVDGRGKRVWTYNTRRYNSKSHHYGGSLTYTSDGTIYVTNGTKDLIALDAKTGIEINRAVVGDAVKNPVSIIDDRIFLISNGNMLTMFDRRYLKKLLAEENIDQTLMANKISSVIRIRDAVLAPYTNSKLVLYRLSDMHREWSIDLSDQKYSNETDLLDIQNQIIVDNELLFVTAGNFLYKIDNLRGTVLAKREAPDITNITKINNTIYVTNNAMQIAAIDAETLKVVWVADLFNQKKKYTVSNCYTKPVVVNGEYLLIVSSEGILYKIDYHSGSIMDQVKIPKDIVDIVWSKDNVYLVSDTDVYVYN